MCYSRKDGEFKFGGGILFRCIDMLCAHMAMWLAFIYK